MKTRFLKIAVILGVIFLMANFFTINLSISTKNAEVRILNKIALAHSDPANCYDCGQGYLDYCGYFKGSGLPAFAGPYCA